MSLINDRVSLKGLPANTKLRLRSGEEVVFTVGSISDGQPRLSNDLDYELNGVCSLDSPEKLNDRDVVGIVTNIDLNNVKEGDFVKLRNGKTVIVEKKNDKNNQISAYINGHWYWTNGLRYWRFISQLDVVEILSSTDRVDLSGVVVGDSLKLRNGNTVVVTKTDTSCRPVYAGIWYKRNGTSSYRGDDEIAPDDVVEILKKESKAETYFKYLALSLLADVSEDRLLTVPSNVVLDIIKETHIDVTPDKVSTAFVALLEGFCRSNETVNLPAKALRDLINL